MTFIKEFFAQLFGKLLGYSDFLIGFFAGKKQSEYQTKEYEADVFKKQRDIANSGDSDPIARMRDNEL